MQASLLILAMLIASSEIVAAETDIIPCPVHKVGDTYKFNRDGETASFTIEAVNGDVLDAANPKGIKVQFDRMMNVIRGRDGRAYSPKYYTVPECPIKLGETRTYTGVSFKGGSGADIKGNVEIKVDPVFVNTKTPAGEFRAVKIISVLRYNWERDMQTGSGTTTHTTYVSSEGIPVKTSSYDDSSRNRGSMELVEKPK